MGSSTSKQRAKCTDQNSSLSQSLSLPIYGTSEDTGNWEKIAWNSREPDVEVNGMIGTVALKNQDADLHVRISSFGSKPMEEKDITVVSRENLRLAVVNGYELPEKRVEHEHFDVLTSCSKENSVSNENSALVLKNKLRSIEVMGANKALRHGDSHACSFRCVESGDGLRLLLSSVIPPARSITGPSRFRDCSKKFSCRERLYQNENDGIDCSEALGPHWVNEDSSLSKIERMGDVEEPSSPLFDPSILATFERAIEVSSDDCWQSSDTSTTCSSRVVCSSLDEYSDADSSYWPEEIVITPDSFELCEAGVEKGEPNTIGANADKPIDKQKRILTSIFTRTQNTNLEDFEWKCPPGCEDKIVLYFTSLRGVRETYDNCCLVRGILKGWGVQVDERDIWMHSKFREELTNALGAASPVPRLFIKGRYIGGAEDVKRLHEEGIFEGLLEGLPAECDNMCDVCGGIRFVPCTSCGGSCKMVSLDEVSRCPDCNENGLIWCPSCGL